MYISRRSAMGLRPPSRRTAAFDLPLMSSTHKAELTQ